MLSALLATHTSAAASAAASTALQPVQAQPATTPNVTLNNGVVMPMVSLGTGWSVGKDVVGNVREALRLGITHIDTSICYHTQKDVGAALAGQPRSSFFITTKVDPDGDCVEPMHADTAYRQTQEQLQRNLDELQLAQTDLVLIHYPPMIADQGEYCAVIGEMWRAFEDHYAQGKTRAIGVSNFCKSTFNCLKGKVTPAVNQVNYHLGMGEDPDGMASFSRSRGIVLQAYSPLSTCTESAVDELVRGERVTRIGARHGRSGAQVSLRWLLQRGVPLSTRATSGTHLHEAADVFTGWQLGDDEMAELNAASSPGGKTSNRCSS